MVRYYYLQLTSDSDYYGLASSADVLWHWQGGQWPRWQQPDHLRWTAEASLQVRQCSESKRFVFFWHTTTMALTASDDINNHCLQLGASWLTFPYREGYQRLVRWLKSFKVLLNKVCDSFSVSVGRSKAGLLQSLKHWLYCHTEHHYPMEERIPKTSLDRLCWYESCIWLSGP